ncbi:hypothetical protein J4050_05110 [Winogradskyella sp. DF17]|uniref:Uncharacterized protein n=1 Tax=Winogradskyella pelagia TaxID=2819984 RepID=A0ABS3T051_9FLAO|nr:DUF6090 family protein [Winogradskyella sp. DF17]MBO3116114.1 hypothetical protein [Winogradskyella sp. DF17]
MIKFLRHIRKSLLEQNKMGKYFKYAIGEIILVVIGILIALQINNWNENRKNATKETAVLSNINKEFKQNKKQLDSVVEQHELVYTCCTKIMSLFPITSKPEATVLDSLSYQLFWSYGGTTFNPSQTSINALSSTSSFDIIKNDTLKDLLISWNDLIDDYQEEELRSREHMIEQYDPYMANHFDFNFNFNDQRNDFEALQTLKFEYLVKNTHLLVEDILFNSGELQKVQHTVETIIALTEPTTK